jgi:site-specific DNA-methyltransferase (adenine-specific)
MKSHYNFLPPLLEEEFQSLKSSIKETTVEVPIIVDQDDEIIDGFHRQKACDELGVFCPREVRHFESDAQRFEVILNLNCRRRQLNREQKRKLIEVYLIRDPQIADNFLGELIGVSKNTVSDVRRKLESTCQIDKFMKLRGKDGKVRRRQKRIVANTANEATKAAKIVGHLPEAADGKLFDVNTAERRAKRNRFRIERERERVRLESERIVKPVDSDRIHIHHCPFQKLEQIAGIEPESVPLILTDPPYGNDFMDQWDALGAFASRVLKPGGLFVAHVGHHRLDEKMAAFGRHLQYRWMGNSCWEGEASYVASLTIASKWIPVVIYSKGDWTRSNKWCDRFHFELKEKSWHRWQRPLAEIEKLLCYFSSHDDLVVDPCGGGFTTAIACERSGRRCISCDVDKVAVIKGIRRLEEERQPTFEEEAVYDTLPVNFGGTDGVDCGSFGSSYTLPINVETTACEHLGSTC